MKKVLLIVVMILCLCGCRNEYNLTIENDKINEDIDIIIPKSLIYDYSHVDSDIQINKDDRITPFLKNDQYALKNKKYQKEVTEDNDNYYVNLSYEYSSEEFGDGKALELCFENVEYQNNNEYYLISLSGRFYCLYGDEVSINIETKNIVEKNNAEKVKNNLYSWTINKDNVTDTSIELKILKKTKTENNILISLCITIVIVVAICMTFIIKKVIDRKKTNEV